MKKQLGMTLLEVIVAVSVFALVATTLSGSISAGMRRSGQLFEKQMATWVAENLLNEARLRGQVFALAAVEGSEEMMGITWFWTAQGYPESDGKMWRNEIKIRTEQSSRQPIAELSSWYSTDTVSLKNETSSR